VLLINKPYGWSSFEVLEHVRDSAGIKKLGHTGTLDPLATGLMALCSGRATRTIAQIQKQPKAYEAEITFGASTSSFDAETAVEKTLPFNYINRTDVKKTLTQNFLGEVWQLPPMFSAVRKKGQRLYEFARQGKVVKRDPRKIEIHR